jgi:hypothetical protein
MPASSLSLHARVVFGVGHTAEERGESKTMKERAGIKEERKRTEAPPVGRIETKQALVRHACQSCCLRQPPSHRPTRVWEEDQGKTR